MDARPHGGGTGRVARRLPELLRSQEGSGLDLVVFGGDRRRHDRPPFSGRLRHLAWGRLKRLLEDQLLLPRLAALGGVDLFHATIPLAPRRMPVPTVVHCYDLTALDRSLSKGKGWMARYERWCLRRALREASVLVAPSEATRQRLVQEAGIAAQRVVRIYPPLPDLEEAAEDLPDGVDEPFLLSVGTLEPRKNLATLVAAHRAVWQQRRAPLVLVGAYGWGSRGLVRRIEASEGAVRWLGWVPDRVLSALYRRAAAVVQISREEGFSYPVAEALQAGAPLVVSDIPVHAEVAGDLARRVGVEDRPGIAAALLEALDTARADSRRLAAARRVEELRAGGRAAAYRGIYGGLSGSGPV